MRIGQPRLLFQFLLPAAGIALAHATAVVLIQFIVLNNGYQAVGIRRVGSIAGLLQAARPTLIVRNLQFEKKSITCSPFQEIGMVFIRVFRIAISAETFIAGIVIMPHRPSAPVASTLDAEVVVALTRQLAVSGTTLQQPLGQRDAGRYLMTLHLLHGKGSILFDILIVAGIPALCLHCCNGNKKKCYDSSQSENPFHA